MGSKSRKNNLFNMILNEEFIIPSIAGRLGNNMFMIANAYARALDCNKQMVALKGQVIHAGIDYSQNMFRKIDFIDEYTLTDKITVYAGYFQSEVYFEKYCENVKSIFTAPCEFVERIKQEMPTIFNSIITTIHIRRGDYLHYPSYHPSISAEYIHEAIKHISNTDNYLVFSDDLEWCKANLKLNDSVTYMNNYLPHEQIWIMSMCDNFIIANSSFSWWGAYLSRKKNKIVIAPEIWYGPDGPKDWEEIYCKNWIKFPSYYKNGLIYPTL